MHYVPVYPVKLCIQKVVIVGLRAIQQHAPVGKRRILPFLGHGSFNRGMQVQNDLGQSRRQTRLLERHVELPKLFLQIGLVLRDALNRRQKALARKQVETLQDGGCCRGVAEGAVVLTGRGKRHALELMLGINGAVGIVAKD